MRDLNSQAGFGTDSKLSRGERWLFAVLLLVQLIPFWSVPYLPTQDGPVHLEMAAIMARLEAGNDPVTEHYLRLNLEPQPNWFIYLPLAASFDAMAPRYAEKLLLSLYALALPLTALYAVRRLGGASAAAFLAFPFVYNYPLHMGFYDFCWSLPLFFLVLGWWWPRRAAPTMGGTVGLATLLLMVFLAHPVTWVLTLVLLGAVIGWEGWLLSSSSHGRERWRRGLSMAGRPAASVVFASLPSIALMMLFLVHQGLGQSGRLSFSVLLRELLLVESLVSYQRLEIAVSVALGALFVGLVISALRSQARPKASDALLAAALLFVLIYFIAPDGISGGGYVNPRVQLFVFLVLIPWLATESGASRRRVLVAAAAGIAIAFLVLHTFSYRRLGGELVQYETAAATIPAGSTVLPLSLANRGGLGRRISFRVRPFQNALGYAVAQRPLVNLANYQEQQDYFPVAYRQQCDPMRWLGGPDRLLTDTPDPELTGYARRPGCSIDYVLLWHPLSSAHRPELARLHASLAAAGFREMTLPSSVGDAAEVWSHEPKASPLGARASRSPEPRLAPPPGDP